MVTITRMPKSNNVAVDGSGLTDWNLARSPDVDLPSIKREKAPMLVKSAPDPAATAKSANNTDILSCGGTPPGINTVAVG
jgi:hypothetical protein